MFMKVLIWFLWLMVFAIIQGLVNLGFFPTVLLLWLFSYLASACCRDWEKQKILKDAEKAALTPFEYLKDKFPNDILAECEKRRGNKAELEKYLEEQRKDLNIKKVYQEFLLEEFLQAPKEEVPTVFAPSLAVISIGVSFKIESTNALCSACPLWSLSETLTLCSIV